MTWEPSCHPSVCLFHDPAWIVAVAKLYPNLLRWLVSESRRYYRQNVEWMCLFQIAEWMWMITTPVIIIEQDYK